MSGPNLNGIKKLIKENEQDSNKTKEVDSPYAKYNSRGQLSCIVCGTPVKSKIIWQAHIIKRSHKENLAKLLDKQKEISNLQFKSNNKPAEKRLLTTQSTDKDDIPAKKPCSTKPKGILKNFTYGSSDEDSDGEVEVPDHKPPSLPPVKKEIESDFIDDKSVTMKAINSRLLDVNEAASKQSKVPSSALPEGFFDDPKADAKARHVEYVNKEEEEYENFMKEVNVVVEESKQIIAEDKEEAAIETQMEQATEQIRYYERVVELDKAKKSQPRENVVKSEESDSGGSSDEEFSTIIWRTKNSLI